MAQAPKQEEKQMKKLRIFYLEHCPYCRKAREALNELKTENAEYENAQVEWIEETRSPEIADGYDYYRVPSIFCDDKKLYECSPADDYVKIKAQVEEALKASLKE